MLWVFVEESFDEGFAICEAGTRVFYGGIDDLLVDGEGVVLVLSEGEFSTD